MKTSIHGGMTNEAMRKEVVRCVSEGMPIPLLEEEHTVVEVVYKAFYIADCHAGQGMFSTGEYEGNGYVAKANISTGEFSLFKKIM